MKTFPIKRLFINAILSQRLSNIKLHNVKNLQPRIRGWSTQELWFDSQQGYETRLFFKMSRTIQAKPSIQWAGGGGAIFLRVKLPVHKAGQLPPSRADVKNKWIYTSTTLPYLHDLYGDKFGLPYFTLKWSRTDQDISFGHYSNVSLFSYAVHFMTLSILQNVQRRTLRWLMSWELFVRKHQWPNQSPNQEPA
jgi:hypothetical protein